MKKAYTKPEIVFESFSLDTHIAANCEKIVGNHAAGACGIEYGDLVIFIEGKTGCSTDIGVTKTPAGDDGTYDGYCYHVPVDAADMFNS